MRFWSGCSTDSSRQMHAFSRASASSETASATRSSKERRQAETHPPDHLAYNLARSSRSRAEKRSSRRWTRTTRRKDFDSTRRCSSTAGGGRGCCAGSSIIDEKTGHIRQARPLILDRVTCRHHHRCLSSGDLYLLVRGLAETRRRYVGSAATAPPGHRLVQQRASVPTWKAQ